MEMLNRRRRRSFAVRPVSCLFAVTVMAIVFLRDESRGPISSSPALIVGVWEDSDAQLGTITLSMTWITPFEVSTSVAITWASLMNTCPSSTRMATDPPSTVSADSSSTT